MMMMIMIMMMGETHRLWTNGSSQDDIPSHVDGESLLK